MSGREKTPGSWLCHGDTLLFALALLSLLLAWPLQSRGLVLAGCAFGIAGHVAMAVIERRERV